MYPFFDLLCSPQHKEKLFFNKSSNCLTSDEGNFEIIEGIPILLPKGQTPHYVQHYQTDAEYFDYFEQRFKETQAEERRLYEFVFKLIPPRAKLIVDIGCGGSPLAGKLLAYNRYLVSCDISFKNVEKSLQIFPSENHFGVVAYGYYLPFKDNTFDCVIATEVLEHLHYPETFIQEVYRIVKPLGKIIISTPYKEKIKQTLCIHCNRPTPINAHLHSFDERKVEEIILKSIGNCQYNFIKFGNKIVQYFRLYRILSILPFFLWKQFDGLLNLIFPKPVHLLVEINKG